MSKPSQHDEIAYGVVPLSSSISISAGSRSEEAVMIHIKRAQTHDILPYAAKTYKRQKER
ncbi:hypothetical protein ACEQPO_29335 [Bacillus sp. SL00103]